LLNDRNGVAPLHVKIVDCRRRSKCFAVGTNLGSWENVIPVVFQSLIRGIAVSLCAVMSSTELLRGGTGVYVAIDRRAMLV
jgi:hypothetical protein